MVDGGEESRISQSNTNRKTTQRRKFTLKLKTEFLFIIFNSGIFFFFLWNNNLLLPLKKGAYSKMYQNYIYTSSATITATTVLKF